MFSPNCQTSQLSGQSRRKHGLHSTRCRTTRFFVPSGPVKLGSVEPKTATTGTLAWADTNGTVDVSGTAVGSGVPASWVCDAHIDNTNNKIDFRVTGVAATTIRWMANIVSTEVTFE